MRTILTSRPTMSVPLYFENSSMLEGERRLIWNKFNLKFELMRVIILLNWTLILFSPLGFIFPKDQLDFCCLPCCVDNFSCLLRLPVPVPLHLYLLSNLIIPVKCTSIYLVWNFLTENHTFHQKRVKRGVKRKWKESEKSSANKLNLHWTNN